MHQTKFGATEGNCFAACIASILDLDLDAVPDFYSLYRALWFYEFQRWLGTFGLSAIALAGLRKEDIPHDCYYLVGGMSERGILHSCVARNGEIVHDPHPSGAGLTNVEDYIFFVRTFA